MARSSQRGFTLVELILVMLIMAIVMAIAAPVLTRSTHQRGLNGEASRFLALIEYGRDEAVSQGIPMVVWMAPDGGSFGVNAQTGFTDNTAREKTFVTNPDVHAEITNGTSVGGLVQAVLFNPDGSMDSTSADSIKFVDKFDSTATIVKAADGSAYSLLKGTK